MPGKFEGNADEKLAEVLHSLTLDNSWTDTETGNVDENGYWFGLLHFEKDEHIKDETLDLFVSRGTYILTEDSQGFFTYTAYAYRSEESKKAWSDIEEGVSAWYGDEEDED